MEITLQRSGKRPIVFVGEELEHFTNKEPGSKRWTVIRIFRLQDGGFVVGIARLTNYLMERDSFDAKKLKTLEKVKWYIKQEDSGLFELMALEEKIGIGIQLDSKQGKEEAVNEKES